MSKQNKPSTKNAGKAKNKAQASTKSTAKQAGGARQKPLAKQAKQRTDIAKRKTRQFAKRFNEQYLEGDKLDKYIDRVDKAIGFIVPRKDYQYDNPAVQAAAGPIRFGLWVFIIVFGFFILWASLAPLSSAAIASGTVVLDANKKIIDHLEGGIIAEIRVKDGDVVDEGEVLIRLSETAPRARLDIVQGQLWAAKAAEDRLIAERDMLDDIVFSPDLLEEKDNPKVAKVMDAQERIFTSRRESIIGQTRILEQRIAQLQEEIAGLEAQDAAVNVQLELINEEIETVQTLLDKGQALKPRLLSLQRQAAQLTGQSGEYRALIARASQSISENEMAILNLSTERMNEVVAELRETQVQIGDLTERVTAARDVLERIEITAPQSGVVNGLKFHTIGGVIPPGKEIMSIVPQDDDLVVEARVKPSDIDTVRAGLVARVRLTAYSVRRVPMLEGTVERVSADSFVDQNTGQKYYTARVRIDDNQIDQLTSNVELYPGMPADVQIVTGERTVLSYLTDPITSTFDKAFREQ